MEVPTHLTTIRTTEYPGISSFPPDRRQHFKTQNQSCKRDKAQDKQEERRPINCHDVMNLSDDAENGSSESTDQNPFHGQGLGSSCSSYWHIHRKCCYEENNDSINLFFKVVNYTKRYSRQRIS